MMTNFWSYHLIINTKLPDDCRHIHEFIDADFFLVERYFYSMFEMDSIHKH